MSAPDETAAPVAAVSDGAAPVPEPAVPDVDCRQQGRVVTWLGATMVLLVLILVGVAVSAVYSGDGNGLNAVRGDAKDGLLYILGVFSGILTPHAVAAARRAS